MHKQQVDALVIGFGKGGKTLAGFMAQKGWEVAVIEKSKQMYGGTCINIACIPSKSLSHSAEQAARRHFATFLEKQDVYQNAVEDKEQLVTFLRGANYAKLNQNPHVSVIDGMATFLSPNEVRVDLDGSDQMIIEAKHIFINTGTLPHLPPIAGLTESEHVYTSTSMMNLSQLPEELVIIGSGHIGLEFAAMYAAFGSHVTVLHRGNLFLPDHDRDIADAVKTTIEKQGIQFHLQANVLQIADRDERASITYVDQTQTRRTLTADAVLIATGRVPNTQSLDLAQAGVEVDEYGFIKVDEFLRTTAPNIWALGDINGGPQFTYISLDDFRIIRDQLFGDGQRSQLSRRNVPSSLFIYPTLSWAGLSETEARHQGYEVKVATLPAGAIPRTRQVAHTDGLLKAIVDAKTKRILGCFLFSEDSSEVINLVSIAMNAGLDYRVLRDNIFTHPSMSEGLNDLFTQIS
ncbi:MAG TPA: FAD-dependent oxidoreductase [Ktedonobacteraceae bacterium]|nr:FAD-dependent oxidoreductase [Ktedonobacteraceae bacterium]